MASSRSREKRGKSLREADEVIQLARERVHVFRSCLPFSAAAEPVTTHGFVLA